MPAWACAGRRRRDTFNVDLRFRLVFVFLKPERFKVNSEFPDIDEHLRERFGHFT